MTDVGRTEAGPEARDAARAIVERHGTSDCSCLRDEFPCEKCHMAIEDIAAVFTEPPPRPAETRTIDALARAIWARLTIRPAGVGVVPDGDDRPDACERAAREESEYELRVIREGIAAALARPAAQAATEMRERAATLIEAAARGIRVEAGDAIDDALAARLVQMVASYADDFAAAIRALPIESARPAAPEDEGIASVDMRRALLAARPVLEACRKLFGGRGMHGPGALEDDCAFALRQIDAALKAAPAAPEDDAGRGLGRSRPEDGPAPVPAAGRPTVEGAA